MYVCMSGLDADAGLMLTVDVIDCQVSEVRTKA